MGSLHWYEQNQSVCVEKSSRSEPDRINITLKNWHGDVRFFEKSIKSLLRFFIAYSPFANFQHEFIALV